MASFSDFLKALPETDDPEGDFVADAKCDERMATIKTWDELETYLITRSAAGEVLVAAKKIWSDYRASS